MTLTRTQADQASALGSATWHEAGGRIGALPARLKAAYPGARFAGRALPVLAPVGDNLWIQRAIYEAVLRAQTESMALMKPGARMGDVHEAAIRILGADLLKLGLVSRNQRDQVRMYFPHGLGHQLGLRVHDVDDRDRALEPGMVVTNEPGIYVRVADVRANPAYLALPANERAGIDAALARHADIGVRIEDDILITNGAPKNLSAAAPRTVEEIEAWMQGGRP